MNEASPLLIVITGPTAVGKTSLSIRLAKRWQTEIVSCDSRQFYRELPIGTASPSKEELTAVPHHFVGTLSVRDAYNVSRYETDVLERLSQLFTTYKQVIMTGGAGLYLHAVTHGIDDLPDPDPRLRESLQQRLSSEGVGALQALLRETDPDYYLQVDLSNPKRLLRALEVSLSAHRPYSSLRTNTRRARFFGIVKIGLTLPRNELYERINHRVDAMIEAGLVEEARKMLPYRKLNALNTVGYKELFRYFDGECTLPDAIEKIKTNSRRYAKRQETWFAKDPEIHWFDPGNFDDIHQFISEQCNDTPPNPPPDSVRPCP